MFLSPEVWPFHRVGGLAEVAHDLPLALGARGHRVEVVTPKVKLPPELEETLETVPVTLEVPVSWRRHQAKVQRHRLGPGVTVWFINHDHLFDREGLYGNAYGDYEDNCERFIFYSRAALELALALDWRPQVVQANDWTVGLVPLYLKSLYASHPQLGTSASVMSVHNLANQGVFWHYDMPLTGLGWEHFHPEGIEFYGKINFLKAGLIFSELITTVSHSYAQEILAPQMGCGLEGVLAARRERLVAVLNGVDYQTWDPATDPHLAANYSAADLAPRRLCRAELRQALGLGQDTGRPLAAFVGRLLDRRGMDILAPAVERILDMGLELIFMGQGEDRYHALLTALARKRPGELAVHIGFDNALAHKIMAGADLLLMPSRFEPCGLHQMQAMRYGCIPVVRATGGLKDTVEDHQPQRPGVGFVFEPYSSEALLGALRRAVATYGQPQQWQGLMTRAMAKDFSWDSAAPRYEQIYQRAVALRQES
jgi:starch synthase